jgi:hypothetical protein
MVTALDTAELRIRHPLKQSNGHELFTTLKKALSQHGYHIIYSIIQCKEKEHSLFISISQT